MRRERRARIKTDDEGNYCIGMSNGRVAIVDQYNPDHAKLTELLDRIEAMAQPSPQKLAAITAKEQFRQERRAKHAARTKPVNSDAMQVGRAPRKNTGKMMWEMVLLGRRIGPVGR